MATTIKLDPLVSTEGIAKEDGRPTEYFLRKWNELELISEAIPGDLAGVVFAAGTGLEGGGVLGTDDPITYTLADTAVTPDTYGSATNVPQITIDQQGRITLAAEVAISIPATFLDLTDTPANYTGSAGLFAAVNGAEDGLEFIAGGGGGGAAGSGTLEFVGEFNVATALDTFIDFDLPDDYNEFYVVLYGTLGASNTGITFVGSADGGATFETGASYYKSSSSNAAANINLADGASFGASRPVQCQFSLSKDVTGAKQFVLNGIVFSSTSGGSAQTLRVAGYPQSGYNAASYIIDAAQIALGAGTMDLLSVKVWGVAETPSATSTDILHVREEQPSGTPAGTSLAATTQTRVLNTTVLNTITGASLAANQFTLPAGTYDVWAKAPSLDSGRTRVQIYNVTDAAIELVGTSQFNFSTDNQVEVAELFGRIVIAATKVFELRHFINLGRATNGLGIEVSDGSVEVYGSVFIRPADLTSGGGGGGISGIDTEDDGVSILAAATTLDFTGAGVTVTDEGSGKAGVAIPGGGGGGSSGLPTEVYHPGTGAATNTFGRACRGQITELTEDIVVEAMAANFDPASTPWTYQCMIAELTGTTVDVIHKTEAIAGTGTVENSVRFNFTSPVTLTSGTRIAILCVRTDGVGTTAVRTQFSSYWAPYGFGNESQTLIVEQSAADVNVSDVLTTSSNAGSHNIGLFLQGQGITPLTMQVQDQQPNTTQGGSSVAGTNIRVLNTVVNNNITGASLSANQVTLPAGTYIIEGLAQAFDCNAVRAYIYDVTAAADLIVGRVRYYGTGDTTVADTSVRGQVTLTVETVIELRQWFQVAKATNGLGAQAADGRIEIYGQLNIERIA